MENALFKVAHAVEGLPFIQFQLASFLAEILPDWEIAVFLPVK